MFRYASILCVIYIISLTSAVHGQPFRPTRPVLLVQQQTAPTVQQSINPLPARVGKSPARAFLFSAVFPGAGELYAGKKRGLFFSALEIGVLTSAIMFDRRGDSRKRGVIAFADAHWDSVRCLPGCVDPNVGTEALGPYGSQQYYEQIGKYNKFQEGWDDYDPLNIGLSSNRQTYVAMRHDMNQAYKWSTWSTGILLINHAVSAIHAALSVRADNRAAAAPQESRFRLGIESVDAGGRLSPSATLSLTF